MFVIVWEFRIRIERREEFEGAYGSDGDWAGLFRQCDGYVDTELLRDAEQPEHYLTVDYWREPEDHIRAMRQLGDAYQALDKRCAEYTITEKRLGNYVKR